MSSYLEAGSHLVVSRTNYSHHGIYVGGGKVIHYSGSASSSTESSDYTGIIEEVTLSHFADGAKYSVIKHENPKFTGLDIVKRAKSRLGEDKYSVLFNNCEHFCEWCINGKPKSKQVRDGVGSAIAGRSVGGVVSATTGVGTAAAAVFGTGLASTVFAPAALGVGAAYGIYRFAKWLRD